ncbi:MAG TPA: formyltetrahydrofolate deformylase [Planctomycetota bacterium]|nr:formyltetrahydrofolate deformylase [Planctomycetota bacterium]
MDRDSRRSYILSLQCPDRVGIVAAVSQFVASQGGWILESSHHSDVESGQFFMRDQILASSLPIGVEGFREKFEPLAKSFSMTWRISDTSIPKRVVLLVSKQDHCLSDLLHRWRNREMDVEIPCVISNHEDLREFVAFHKIPFHHVPVPEQDREPAFRRMAALLAEARADCVVLARYMQVLPEGLTREYAGRILNIHHSFLPSFSGARPYHAAFERGVKLIGATCHYVTAELDAGPIIDQDVMRVDHGDTVAEMMRLGRDVEKMVLARGVRYHLQDRVMIHGNKTVVFS